LVSLPINTERGGVILLPNVQILVAGIEIHWVNCAQNPMSMLHAAVVGRFQMATKPIPLSEVERVWSSDAYMPRVVFTIGEQRG
jgi:hypothetical protein